MSEGLLFAVEGLLVLACIAMGVRSGGVGIALWTGAGTAALVFLFGEDPGTPPIDAVFIILAVVLAAGAMEAANGIHYLVSIAARVIRRNPKRVTLVAPLVSFGFAAGAGTSNILFPLIPVIYETAYENEIRPERPLAPSVMAGAAGVVCSPVSAAMASILTLVNTPEHGMEMIDILVIIVPGCLLAVLACSAVMYRKGRELADDPEFQRRRAAGLVPAPVGTEAAVNNPLARQGRPSALIFLGGVLLIVVLGLFQDLRPQVTAEGGGTEPLGMTTIIELVMFTAALLIMLVSRLQPGKISSSDVFRSGVVSAIALFGVAWLADTYVTAHLDLITGALDDMVQAVPLTFALALFVVAALTGSQSAATRIMVPIGLAVGLSATAVVAMWPAASGILLFPSNGPQLASVQFDHTGTTKIGDAVVNHSFIRPMFTFLPVAVLASAVMSLLVT